MASSLVSEAERDVPCKCGSIPFGEWPAWLGLGVMLEVAGQMDGAWITEHWDATLRIRAGPEKWGEGRRVRKAFCWGLTSYHHALGWRPSSSCY